MKYWRWGGISGSNLEESVKIASARYASKFGASPKTARVNKKHLKEEKMLHGVLVQVVGGNLVPPSYLDFPISKDLLKSS